MADFQKEYGIRLADAVFGESPWSAAELLALIARLPEGSMYVSQLRDRDHWREYLDVDAKYYVLAGIFNAVNDNTRGTGNWPKGKAPKFKPWPTPDILAKKAKAKPRNLDDLFVSLGGGRPVAPEGVLIIGQE